MACAIIALFMGTHFLSLIVPVYRQEKTIVEDLKRMKYVLDHIRYDHQLIVVVDGMIDQSFDVIKKANIPNVTCIAYPKNHGKSYAIRLGMNYAQGTYVMFLDAGMEIDPNGISMLLEHMDWYDADIIVGSKRHPASKVNYPLMRKVLSYGYYLFVRTLFNVNVKDTQAGIKIFRKKVLQKILPKLIEKKFAGDLEMLVVAKRNGFSAIYEAPIKLDYTMANITSAATFRSIWYIFIDTMAIFYRTYMLRFYDHVPSRTIHPPKGTIIINT